MNINNLFYKNIREKKDIKKKLINLIIIFIDALKILIYSIHKTFIYLKVKEK